MEIDPVVQRYIDFNMAAIELAAHGDAAIMPIVEVVSANRETVRQVRSRNLLDRLDQTTPN